MDSSIHLSRFEIILLIFKNLAVTFGNEVALYVNAGPYQKMCSTARAFALSIWLADLENP